MKKRFLADFTIAYDSLGKKTPQEETEKEKDKEQDQGKDNVKEKEKEKIKKPDKSVLLQAFQKDAEANVAAEIDARLVCLTTDGSHPELTQDKVSSTRLYANLTRYVRFMGFYDVKNALLLDRRQDESIVQREPLVDMDQFGRFCAVAHALMQPKQGFALDLAREVRTRFPKSP